MGLGFERNWIEIQLSKGYHFDLFLFPEQNEKHKAVQATWNGIFELLKTNDPEIYERVSRFGEELQTKSFDEIESKSDFCFLDVYEAGRKDPRNLTKERFLNIDPKEMTLCDVRFFLYCYMGLSKYYAGDGYTKTKNGERGSKEYLMKNTKIKDIEHLKAVHLNVQLPEIE